MSPDWDPPTPYIIKKLLEELHEEGVRKSGYDGGSPITHIFTDGEIAISDVRGIRKQVFFSFSAPYAQSGRRSALQMLLNTAAILRRENLENSGISAAFSGISASPDGPGQAPGKESSSKESGSGSKSIPGWGNDSSLPRLSPPNL